MNYQYRHGTDTATALKTLYRQGGIPRFYQVRMVYMADSPSLLPHCPPSIPPGYTARQVYWPCLPCLGPAGRVGLVLLDLAPLGILALPFFCVAPLDTLKRAP